MHRTAVDLQMPFKLLQKNRRYSNIHYEFSQLHSS